MISRKIWGIIKTAKNFNINLRSNHIKTNIPMKIYTKEAIFGVIIGSIVYDGFNEFEIYGGVFRFLRSLKIAALISIDYLWSLNGLVDGTQIYEQTLKNVNLRSANRLLNGCLSNGGLYIKIGQGVSAINHILPYEYTNTLKKLENDCLLRKPNEVKRVFEIEFGKSPEELFETFDYKPVAAASLAQVFRGKTKDGKDVAVKVQYIDLAKRFSGDFLTILTIQKLIAFVHKNYNFGWILKDLRQNLEQELDFIIEAKNSERCAEDLKKFNFVYIPKVQWDLTSKRVLTAEWIDGYKISDIERIKKDKLCIADINRKLFQIFSEQIFMTGFVHADPHPGNVFVRKRENGKPEIILLDHGLYEHIPPLIRLSLCLFWESIVLKDQKKMDKYAKELNVGDSNKFAEILLQRPINIRNMGFSSRLTDSDIAYFQADAKRHFDVVLNTLKQMPRNMLFVIRNLNTVRAIARHHGDPIDRPIFIAKYAQKCIFTMGKFSFMQRLVHRFRFDYHLFKMSLHFWFIRFYLDTLACFGRSPADSNTILNFIEYYE